MLRGRPAIAQDGSLERIHEASLELLSTVGCAILDRDAVDLLAARGAKTQGAIVRIGEGLVRASLCTAPPAYTVCGRRPELDLVVGGLAEPVLGGAGGPALVLDGGRRRSGTLSDLRTAIALAHMSKNIDVHGGSVDPADVPGDSRSRVVAHAHVVGSDKASRLLVPALRELRVATDIAEILYGGKWYERPRLWSVVNSTSPLQLSGDAARVVMRLARLGQPVCVTACAMGGATAPLSLAGLLALQHAEVLAGLVLTQAARPGCPFLYGGTSSIASMRNGALLVGAPEYWVLTQATVELGHWLNLPVRAGGALTDAHVPDAQAGAQSALGIHMALEAGADVVLHAAGILSSFNCYSPAKFVMDDQLVSDLAVARQSVTANDESLGLEALAAAGPGGSMLRQAHTRRHAHDGERRTIMNRDSHEAWRARGEPCLADAAVRHMEEQLAEYAAPDDLDSLTRRQLDEYCGV